ITMGGVQTGDTLTIDNQTVSNINADAATTALGGVQAGDTLTIDSQSVSNINADAGTTAMGGASTHSYSISSGVLTIEFAAGTTEAQAQTVLNNIGFAISNSDDPNTTTRTFTGLTVQDSGGVLNGGDDTSAASAVQTDITVVAVNDEPVNTIPGTQTIPEETTTAIGGISISDSDAGVANLNTQLQVGSGI
ncbi:MAG: hypothetical protein GY694_11540, partial [Gammaproteobacteria bacterium]|nr:hypothetical protein [Gammaproteobacteria bacterium]